MIAKRVRKHGGKGLAALVRYVLQEKGPPRDWKRRAADAPGPGGRGVADGVAGGKVDRVRVSGCGAVTDPGRAVRLMELTAAANPTVRAGGRLDAGYHLVASFAPGERPGREALAEIEDTLVRAVGLEEHQRISAAHKDRGHFHLHVVANTVHPVRLTKADLRFDHRALAAACVVLERRHGLVRTNHGELAPALAERVRGAAGPALVRAAEAGEGWAAVHEAAARGAVAGSVGNG